jgi:agmatinase
MANETIDHAITAADLNEAASDPTFAGVQSFLRRKYTKNLEGVDVAVMGIPLDTAVSNRPGTRFGPKAIRAASCIQDNDPVYPFNLELHKALSIIDYGDCLIDYGNQQTIPKAIEDEATKILDAGCYLQTLGGDHYITYPLLKAHAKKYGPLALVQFDAHQDTWEDKGERIDHGTIVTRAVNEGLIDVERSIQVGIRTHAPQDFGLKIIYGNEMVLTDPRELAKRITDHVGDAKTYLTFDIDCLDPAFAPGTGTPVAGGPTSAHALEILYNLHDLDIVGSDVVEVSPAYDHAEITAIAGATVAAYQLCLHALRR